MADMFVTKKDLAKFKSEVSKLIKKRNTVHGL